MTAGALWNLPFWIIGGITVFLLLAWPMGSAPVAPKRRQKRIDTYFRSTLERSNPCTRQGRVVVPASPAGRQSGTLLPNPWRTK